MREAFRVPVGSGDSLEWVSREGERITVEGVEAFLYEDPDGDWKLYEATSGYSMTGYYSTKDEAIARAATLARSYGPEKVKALIADAVKLTGIANPLKEAGCR